MSELSAKMKRALKTFAVVLLLFPVISQADTSDELLARAQRMIDEARNQTSTNSTHILKLPENSTWQNAQNALRPVAPSTSLPSKTQTMPPATTNFPAQNYNNTQNQNQQMTAPSGPPNIFITPGKNTNNNQNSSIIHY